MEELKLENFKLTGIYYSQMDCKLNELLSLSLDVSTYGRKSSSMYKSLENSASSSSHKQLNRTKGVGNNDLHFLQTWVNAAVPKYAEGDMNDKESREGGTN